MSYTPDQIAAIVAAQRQFFRTGTTLDVSWRKEQLRKLKQAVIQRADLLSEAL